MFRRWLGSWGSVDDEVFTDSDSNSDDEVEYNVPEYSPELRYLLMKKRIAMQR